MLEAQKRCEDLPGHGPWHDSFLRAIQAAIQAQALYASGGDVQLIAEKVALASRRLHSGVVQHATSAQELRITQRQVRMNVARRSAKLKASQSHRLAAVYLLTPDRWPSFAHAHRDLSSKPWFKCEERQARQALADLRRNHVMHAEVLGYWNEYRESRGRR